MKISSLILFLSLGCFTFGQLTQEDELRIAELEAIVDGTDHDTLKIKALLEWENIVYFADFHEDSIICKKLLHFCLDHVDAQETEEERLFFYRETARAYNYMGIVFQETESLDSSILMFEQSIAYHEKANQKAASDGAHINMANSLYALGDYDRAIDEYLIGVQFCNETGNDAFKSAGIIGIGNAYLDQHDVVNAKRYYFQALDLSMGSNDLEGLPGIYINLGNAYLEADQIDSALITYHLGLTASKDAHQPDAVATLNHNIGTTYLDLHELDSAIIYLSKGLLIREEEDPHGDLVNSYSSMSDYYYHLGDYNSAIRFGEKAWQRAEELGYPKKILIGTSGLYKAYEKVGKYKDALAVYKRHNEIDSTIQSSDNQRQLLSKDLAYRYNQEKIADSLAFQEQKKLDDLAHEKDLESEAQFRYFLYAGLGFLLILGGLAYRGYRTKKADNAIITQQKELAEHQKEIIEEAHQEITDSIAYAKRIQSAILPPMKMVNELLTDAFILYKPKDVVAGDFYWLEKVNDTLLFAAADCTGHGVPGAMVSVVCNNALNRSVREFGLKDPAAILDQARAIVIQEFEKSEEEVKDGMDIALCALNGYQLSYAGAHNPLWVVRNNEIIEIKADKQPIGKFDQATPFQSHQLELLPGDIIYLFSDGYVDQFGGDKGKKFKAKSLRELLLSIQPLNMADQKRTLDQKFESWRGELEQIDDVCMIGVKIN